MGGDRMGEGRERHRALSQVWMDAPARGAVEDRTTTERTSRRARCSCGEQKNNDGSTTTTLNATTMGWRVEMGVAWARAGTHREALRAACLPRVEERQQAVSLTQLCKHARVSQSAAEGAGARPELWEHASYHHAVKKM